MTLKQALIITASVSAGMVLIGSWAMAQPSPDATRRFLDSFLYVPAIAFVFAVALWIVEDAKEHTDIDIAEVLELPHDEE